MTEKQDDRLQKIYSLLIKLGSEISELKKAVVRLSEATNGGE